MSWVVVFWKLYIKRRLEESLMIREYHTRPNQLSEDIDIAVPEPVDNDLFAEKIKKYFKHKYVYKDLDVSVKGKQKKIYLKFPVLKVLNLSAANETDLVYVKVEPSLIVSKNYSTRISVITRHSVNVLVKHYDLPDLFAGKLHAVLTRS